MSNIAVVTIILPGTYTTPRTPLVVNPDVDHIVLTDDIKYHSPPWVEMELPKDLYHVPTRDEGRPAYYQFRKDLGRFKCLTHEFLAEYEFVIFQDACVLLKVDPVELVDFIKESEYNIAFPPHPWRTCAYREAVACVRMGHDKEGIEKQVARYEEEGFPRDFGMPAVTFSVRNNWDKDVQRLMEFWNEELQNSGPRFQVSFPYAVWKTGVGYDFMREAMPWHENRIFKVG